MFAAKTFATKTFATKTFATKTWIVAAVAAVAFAGLAYADDLSPKSRVELKRADLDKPGSNMEIVLSTSEYQPGDVAARHIHHGDEAFYVVQGATVELPDGKQIELKTGTGSINLRDVPHAGFKVVGTTALKLVTVHVVDKGVPLYDAPPK
jgi:quercetin dioxygenase-like cupin family protein